MYRVICLLTIIIMMLEGCALLSGVKSSARLDELRHKTYQGDLESQYQLGLEYTLRGTGSWDFEEGYNWFRNAAERGHLESLYMTGMGKLIGRGTAMDLEAAATIFKKAAQQGHARAQYQLGMAYVNGNGIAKDTSWGRQWLEQAAWNNHKNGQFILAAMFAGAVGGQINQAEAWQWLKRAESNGHAKAELARRNLEKKMTQQELVKGEVLLAKTTGLAGVYVQPKVRYVQSSLNQLGYPAGDEDGVMGPSTKTAVSRFAQQNNLPAETSIDRLIESLRAIRSQHQKGADQV